MVEAHDKCEEHGRQQKEPNGGSIKVEVVVLLSFLVPVIGHAVLTWRDVSNISSSVSRIEADVRSLDATIGVVAAETHANTIYREERQKGTDYWVEQIQQHEREIQQLQRNEAARSELFTGIDGADLRDRVERLEQKANKEGVE